MEKAVGAVMRCWLIPVVLALMCFLSAQGQDTTPTQATAQAYLYLEPFNARVEVMVDVATVQTWLKQPSDPSAPMPAAARQQLSDSAMKVGAEWCSLLADDLTVRSTMTGVALVKGKPGATLPFAETESPAARELMVGFMYEFSIPGAPNKLDLRWTHFLPPMEKLPLTIFHGNSTSAREITAARPSASWSNEGRLPMPKPLATVPTLPQVKVYAIPLAMIVWIVFGIALYVWMDVKNKKFPGGFVPFLAAWLFGVAITYSLNVHLRDPFAEPSIAVSTPANAEAVLTPLLRNVYRAFDYRRESDIYDLLARSVDGELLRHLYLQIVQSLTLDEQEGARVRITDLSVTIEQVTPQEPGFIAQGQWTALGTVGHWGHQHQRLNRYKAKLTVNPVSSEWKITGLEVLEERRL